MSTTPFELISVFTDFDNEFRGNISAVVLLEEPLKRYEMLQIAQDLNQPATTFLMNREDGSYKTWWYAPDSEIGLCGHGSMAATAYLIGGQANASIEMQARKAMVQGYTDEEGICTIALDPIPVIEEIEIPVDVRAGLSIPLNALYKTSNKYILLANNEEDIRNVEPDFARLRQSDIFGYALTAPGDDVDFVSRTLVPHVRQLEDHATGSSHAVLTPFWAERLDKTEMRSLQLSPRGGKFQMQLKDDKVHLSGDYERIAKGTLLL